VLRQKRHRPSSLRGIESAVCRGRNMPHQKRRLVTEESSCLSSARTEDVTSANRLPWPETWSGCAACFFFASTQARRCSLAPSWTSCLAFSTVLLVVPTVAENYRHDVVVPARARDTTADVNPLFVVSTTLDLESLRAAPRRNRLHADLFARPSLLRRIADRRNLNPLTA
jgi:hypothetical protein